MPLKRIGRDPTPNTDFLDDFVIMAPLEGEAFAIDSAGDVHTYIVNFVVGNGPPKLNYRCKKDRMTDA
jgi:hypothetical protein